MAVVVGCGRVTGRRASAVQITTGVGGCLGQEADVAQLLLDALIDLVIVELRVGNLLPGLVGGFIVLGGQFRVFWGELGDLLSG